MVGRRTIPAIDNIFSDGSINRLISPCWAVKDIGEFLHAAIFTTEKAPITSPEEKVARVLFHILLSG
jgi:hypothetical protein